MPPLRSSSSSSSSRTSIGGDCTECAIAGQPLRTLCLAGRVDHVEDDGRVLSSALRGTDLATYLKTATHQPHVTDPQIAEVVSRVLLDVEREGEAAGVSRIAACAPPHDAGGIAAPMVYALLAGGADEVLCIGGAHGVAALASGIEDVEPVDMIIGAGNAYVSEAKRQLFGRVGIDLLA